MPVDLEEFLQGLAILADNHNLRVTLKQSGKGAVVCGAMCFIGGLLGGPPGLAIGGTLGGITAYRMSNSMFNVNDKLIFFILKLNHKSVLLINSSILIIIDFRTVGDIIRHDLTTEEKWRLQEHIVNSVRGVHPTDLAILMPLILNTPSLQEAVLKTVVTFISNEMRYTIANVPN